MFEGQEIKIILTNGTTMYNLACTARICGLVRNDRGTKKIRWDDVKKKLEFISNASGDESSTPKVKAEVNYILDEIENTDDRNSIYMSS